MFMYAFLLFNTYSVVYPCSYLLLLLLYIYLNLLGPLNCKVYLCIFVYISSILFGLYLIQPLILPSAYPNNFCSSNTSTISSYLSVDLTLYLSIIYFYSYAELVFEKCLYCCQCVQSWCLCVYINNFSPFQ